MKKYLLFCTLAILSVLFGCEEENPFRLYTAPEYYQGRATLPTGQQIEMTESDRTKVLDACYPKNAITYVPNGDRRLLGTVTLTQPLTTTTSTEAFPTATFFEVENQSYVQCQASTITYIKRVSSVPNSLIAFRDLSVTYPSTSKLRNAQPHERIQFLKEMDKPVGNEPYPLRTALEQTLVHVTVPFNGSYELTFESADRSEVVVTPIDSSSRQPVLSIGFGTESADGEHRYGIYTSSNQELYRDVIRPFDATFDRFLGARSVDTLPSTLVANERYPLFSFSFIRDGKVYKQIVSITYKEETLLHGDKLKQAMHQRFANRRHVVRHELALIGTESKDEPFLTHVTTDDTRFIFNAIDRAKAVSQAGTPASIPYLTVFKGISAQTFDVSYEGNDVFLTNTKTESHFKLLHEDAKHWHDRFDGRKR